MNHLFDNQMESIDSHWPSADNKRNWSNSGRGEIDLVYSITAIKAIFITFLDDC